MKMNTDKALKLIKENRIFGLAAYDGCLCTHFSVQGIDVDIKCRKSSHGQHPFDKDFYGTVIRVSSGDVFQKFPGLQIVANEVQEQIIELESSPTLIRLCDFRFDKECTCIWCGKPREDKEGYYCNEHHDHAGVL